MAASLAGRVMWRGGIDDEGYRTWLLTNKVRTTDKNDGPKTVSECPGLPTVGSTYLFGNDVDSWAFCYPFMDIQMLDAHDDNTLTWAVSQKFSTKPMLRCNTIAVADPTQEPQKYGGSFVRYSKAATHDRYGLPILSSSWELFRGREVEFDESFPTVWVEQNVKVLGLDTFSQLVNCVNKTPMWGLASRCIKLSNVSWQRNVYSACSYYYTRRLEFDINYNTFDRNIQDEGTKVLNGKFGVPGTGCTLNITKVGKFGEIQEVSVNAGGSGYALNQTFPLAVNGTIQGEGGMVTVQSNGSGVVTSVVVISNSGTNYLIDTGASTIGTGWVLTNINGQPPNRNNPQHFIRYKDINGECSRVVLDGRGQPAINKYPGYRRVEKYPEASFTILGVPTSF